MTFVQGLTGTTVTLFGGSDPFDHALGDELGRRGCKTHSVSVPMGWLPSATHAIMRLDTAAGADALERLAETPEPRSHVIAVCPEPADAAESERLREICRACGAHHDVALIWHPPLEFGMPATGPAPAGPGTVATGALATTVADELVEHSSVRGPSFVSRPFMLAPRHT